MDPSYCVHCNIGLTKTNMRVKKRGNPMVEGRLVVAAILDGTNDLTWRPLKVYF